MDFELLDHDEYHNPEHPPADSVDAGDTVVLVFRGLAGYRVTEARMARVVSVDGDHLVGELVESGMMVPVAAGERVPFRPRQAFQAPPFGDETLLSVPEV